MRFERLEAEGATVTLKGWGFVNCTTGKLLSSGAMSKWCVEVEKPELDEIYKGEYEWLEVELSYKRPHKPPR